MAYIGLRVHELRIKPEDITLESSEKVFTKKDGWISKAYTIYVKGKGGKESFRPILPQYFEFFKQLKFNSPEGKKIFDLPKDDKKMRDYVGKAILRAAKSIGIEGCQRNHEFRKYHAQLAVECYVIELGWTRQKAENYVVTRHLSHGANREDLKKIYLWS
jgi:hypothetical protein